MGGGRGVGRGGSWGGRGKERKGLETASNLRFPCGC